VGCLITPDVVSSCADNGSQWLGVAWKLSAVAPHAAPRDFVIYANVRRSENSVDRTLPAHTAYRRRASRGTTSVVAIEVMPRMPGTGILGAVSQTPVRLRKVVGFWSKMAQWQSVPSVCLVIRYSVRPAMPSTSSMTRSSVW